MLHVPKGMLLDQKHTRMVTALGYLELGAHLHNTTLPPDEEWMDQPGTSRARDVRALIVTRWQGSRPRWAKGSVPKTWAGMDTSRVRFLLDEGYWLEYLMGL